MGERPRGAEDEHLALCAGHADVEPSEVGEELARLALLIRADQRDKDAVVVAPLAAVDRQQLDAAAAAITAAAAAAAAIAAAAAAAAAAASRR